MSVQTNKYIIYGINSKYNPDFELKYEPFQDSAYRPFQTGLIALYDGMCGEYFITGEVIESTAEGEGFSNPVTLIEPSQGFKEKLVYELFVNFNIQTTVDQLQYFVLTHHR